VLQKLLDTIGNVLNMERSILYKFGGTETEPLLVCLGPLLGAAFGDTGGIKHQPIRSNRLSYITLYNIGLNLYLYRSHGLHEHAAGGAVD
jgi:hypothetical protein